MRRPNSTLEGLIFILLIIPIGVYYLLKWVVQGLVILVYLCMGKNKDDVVCADLSEIDSLDGITFEHFTARLLRKNGYKQVRGTKASGDFGVDVTANKDGKAWVFQCKHYQGNLGIKPVQEVYSGLRKYKAQVAVVVTNSFFTPAAKELAHDLSVILWDRATLSAMIDSSSEPKNGKASCKVKTTEAPPVVQRAETVKSKGFHRLETNQLTANIYVIGKDIPIGTYTFTCVYGEGSISKYSDETTLLGANNYFQWVGSKYEYQSEQCVGVVCKEGEYLHIDGNVVVEIQKSQSVEIDL